jgi:ParB-like chromosome segregation protein Spo0J
MAPKAGQGKYGPYTAHPAAEIFPLMEGDEFAALVADLKVNGQHEPIEILNSQIVDGRNRYLACLAAGIEPEIEVSTSDEWSIVAYVISKNLRRRQLTAGQRAAVALALVPLIEAERLANEMTDEEWEAAKLGNAADRPAPVENFPSVITDDAGARMGVSGRSVRTLAKIKESDPELAEKVADGSITLNKAATVNKPAKPAPDLATGPEPVRSVAYTAQELINALWKVVNALRTDGILLGVFDEILTEDKSLRDALAELIRNEGS